MPKVPRHLHVVSCSLEGMLEFDGPMRQSFGKYLTVSQRGVGACGGKGYEIDRKSKYYIIKEF